ncbi:hypothetical protein ACP70R_005453 [Stipagrostis hirtigluma subsp. patula]
MAAPTGDASPQAAADGREPDRLRFLANACENLTSAPPIESSCGHTRAEECLIPGSESSESKADSQTRTPFPYRRRKRGGRNGGDARFAPGIPTAISRALATAADRKTEQIFYPKLGLSFNSAEEAKEFYNLFSWEVGFGIRKGRQAHNNHGYITRQDFVCSCEGHDPDENSASCRTDCRAMLRLLRSDDDGWYVSRLIEEHNHPLSEGYGEKKQWPSHSQIDPTTKTFIRSLRENNVSLGKVCSILQSGGSMSVEHAFRKESIRSLSARMAQESIREDISKTIKLLQEMKETDPSLTVAVEVDDDGRICTMLWCNGKNKQDYVDFGDVVTFDTTYRTNLYNMPFGLFVGVNNHFQSVIFGGVLFSRETTKAFEWAFSTFVKTMGGAAPRTILTDQCTAMESAIRNVLPLTKHRWCRWHVLRNAKEKVGNKYSKYCSFKAEFHRLVTDVLCRKKFESDWKKILQKYGLQQNGFLHRAYRNREKWAKPYFVGIFCAGMTSTQRSESANHMLKLHIPRASPMHLFVRKYNEFLQYRNDAEARERHVTKQKRRVLRINVPIEKHAQQIYTRAMYQKFGDELFQSGSFAIRKVIPPGRYVVYDTREDPNYAYNEFHVELASDHRIITCNCGLIDHIGMPCCHALKVLVHLDKTEIPELNILRRWTKSASSANARTADQTSVQPRSIASSGLQQNIILLAALNLVKAASTSGTPLDVALRAIEEASNTVTTASSSNMVTTLHLEEASQPSTHLLDITNGNVPYEADPASLLCPKRRVAPGRPPLTRLKSWRDKTAKEKKKIVAAAEAECTTDDVKSINRTKRLSEIISTTHKRQRKN